MSGLSPEQIHYLRDVLGVDSVLLGAASVRAATAVTTGNAASVKLVVEAPPVSESRLSGDLSAARLLVVAAGERGFILDGDAGELANKMIQAMKLAPNDVAILEWTGAVPDDVRDIWENWKGFALSFGELAAAKLTNREAASGAWIEDGNRKMMVTDSPTRLLAETSRKKIAWAHLQTVMKALS